MATHSSVLTWRIPGMAEPGGLPSMRLHRVGHDWSDLAAAAAALVSQYETLSYPQVPEFSKAHISLCLRSRGGPRTGAGHRNVWMNWVYQWIKSKSVACRNPSFLQQANPDQPILLTRDISCRSRLNSSLTSPRWHASFHQLLPSSVLVETTSTSLLLYKCETLPDHPGFWALPGSWKVTALLLKGVSFHLSCTVSKSFNLSGIMNPLLSLVNTMDLLSESCFICTKYMAS